MNESAAKEKPLVSVLMAVYEPRRDWLREQLCSLEAQTCRPVELLIWDDASPHMPLEELCRLVGECVTSFPVTVERGEANRGSDAVFETLTAKARGEYIAYCDQDDIWDPDKLMKMTEAIQSSGARLVCSDMRITDGEGHKLADSITELRRHHVFRSGGGLTATLWQSNFVSGCAMLVRAEDAKAAIPFNPYMYYDHYIALWAASKGELLSLPEASLTHREHGDNQSTLLRGVEDRASYRTIRIEKRLRAVRWLYGNFPADEPLREILPGALAWLEARDAYAGGDRSGARNMWKYRALNKKVTLFELCAPLMPDKWFRRILRMGRENRL